MVGLREWATLYLKGVAMGSADAVPGVSGGTIALIVGIYERLIAAVTAIDPARIRRVLAGVRPANLPDARAAFHEIDGAFLLVLGAGIGTAVVAVLSGVNYLLTTRPVATYGFFFGLIAASAGVLLGGVALDTPRRKAAAVAGFLLAFLASGYASTALGSSLPVVFVAGAVAVSAMVLPGISGSLLLVVLGQYEYMSGTVSRAVDGLVAFLTGDGSDALLATVPPVVAFLAGGVVGLFTVAHAIRYALARARAATLAFLVSLVVGALRAPLVEVSLRLAESGETWRAAAPRFALAAVAGAAFVLVLDRYSAAIEY
jgi:putative membrane protein